MNKLILLIGAIITVTVVAGAGVYLNYYKPQATEPPPVDVTSEAIDQQEDNAPSIAVQKENTAGQGEQKPLVIREIHQEWAADYSRAEILVGASHNIFAAKIIKKLGISKNDPPPYTQFEAELIYNIKGDLSGRVVVEQTGGYYKDVLYVAGSIGDIVGPAKGEEAKYLLQPGYTYILVTAHLKPGDPYHITSFPGAGIKLISDNLDLSNIQLRSLVENNPRAQQLLQAYPNEILLEANVRNNRTYNSFQSLSPAEKQAVYNKIASFSLPPFPLTPVSTSTASSTASSTSN